MSRHLNHLSSAEISAIAAGEPGPEAAAHLENCLPCRREVETFGNALGHFRFAVREWSDARFRDPVGVEPRMRLWPGVAYVCTLAVVVLLSVIGYRFSTQSARNAVAPASVLESDTLLLNHVKADVSRSVPPGMETLLGFASTGAAQR